MADGATISKCRQVCAILMQFFTSQINHKKSTFYKQTDHLLGIEKGCKKIKLIPLYKIKETTILLANNKNKTRCRFFVN